MSLTKKFPEIITDYGFKQEGQTKFIIIAPHAAGDDWKTKRASIQIAKKLNSYLIVNNIFFKPTNPKAVKYPDLAEDFNQLRWGHTKNKYLWATKKPAMKKFYQDVQAFCREIKEKDEIPVAVYIHGIKSQKIGVDIGVGIKAKNEKRLLSKDKNNNINSGLITIKISHLKKLKGELNKELNPLNLRVSVGDRHIGWSKRSAIQFHKHGKRNDFAVQLELNRFLRRKKNIELTSKIISKAIKIAFA